MTEKRGRRKNMCKRWLGDKERDERTVTYRQYGEQKQITVSLDEFVDMVLKQIEEKSR